MVRLCLDLARFNKVPIRPIHRGPPQNDIPPRLAGDKYLTLIDANSGYYNLKLDRQSSCLAHFSCPFNRHTYL